MADYLIYQAYGNPAILNEALFSLLSYLRQAGESTAQILVYTDHPAHFQSVLSEAPAVRYIRIEPAQWQEWRGEINFVHRVKIKVLQHAAAHYAGNLLYVDTDTVFLKPPTEIFAAIARQERFMHIGEGRLCDGNPLNRKINRALRQDAGGMALAGAPVAPDTRMYNAGVLGFRSTDAPLLAEVLTLTERLYRLYPKHVMEQLAFSVVLARAGMVREAAPWVYHYWNLKEIRPVLGTLFTKTPGQTLAAWQARAASLHVPTLAEGKASFRRHPGWRRAVLRWMGRGWQLPSVEFPAL